MLSMNLYCEIILIALQQSLLSDSHHQRKSRSKHFTGPAINLEYQAYLKKSSLNSPDYHSEAINLAEKHPISLSTNSPCLRGYDSIIATRGISCFFTETFIKTSLSSYHDKNCVFMPQCTHLTQGPVLHLRLWDLLLWMLALNCTVLSDDPGLKHFNAQE